MLLLSLLIFLIGAARPAACAQSADPDVIRGEISGGRYSDAERHSRQLLLETDRLHGVESLESAEALDLLAEAMRRGGKSADAEALSVCLRALEIKGRLLPPTDASLAVSLENLGALRMINGDHVGAREPLERALRLRTEALGPWSREVSRSLIYLGSLEHSVARVDSALALVRRAIAIQDSMLPAEDPARVQALTMLGGILYSGGEYTEAGTIMERALSLQTRAFGLEHPHTINLLHNLGAICTEMGDYAEARRYLEEARAGMIRVLRRGHPLLARTLVVLASVHEYSNDPDGALRLFREALAIQRKAYGWDHADVGWTLMKLGRLETARGQRGLAKRDLLAALRIQEKVLSPGHPDFGWTLSALAKVEIEIDSLDLAEAHCARALAIQEKVLGPHHPDLAPTLATCAKVHAMKGDTALAVELVLRSARIRTEHLRLTAGGLAERQALAYAAVGPTGLDLLLSLITAPGSSAPPSLAREAWEAVIHGRTLVLDEMAARHRAALADTADRATAEARETLRGARQRLANMLVRGPKDDSADRYQALIERARLDMERAERRLGERSAQFRVDEAESRRGIDDVFASMPSGWGLVAYVSHADGPHRRYVAFVRGKGADPIAVPIGDADRIDALVRRWATDILADPSDSGPAAQRAEAASRASGRLLRASVWDPVARALGSAEGVLIVPDGALYGINFGALPDGESGYLVEGGSLLHYVSSELDIAGGARPQPHGTGLLAMGGVDFDTRPVVPRRHQAKRSVPGAPSTATPTERMPAPAPPEDCHGFYDATFLPLPQSRLEVEEIAGTWSDPTDVKVITGRDATEAAFKRLAVGKRVLHLATHGFFLDPDRCLPVGSAGRGIAGLEKAVRPPPPPAFQQQSPLLLSGLALAFANRRSETTAHEEDGILTAEEVASLDLRGVEWAVLSACDTGVTGSSRGEGILGLRRAFQTAGVATLVISLWPVQDAAAREWMRALYQARIRSGAGTAQAVRSAMLETLRSRRAQGRSTNPSFWAAFLATGDWE